VGKLSKTLLEASLSMGVSIGCFLKFSTSADGWPADMLVLVELVETGQRRWDMAREHQTPEAGPQCE
jgi:hypothetical protein